MAKITQISLNTNVYIKVSNQTSTQLNDHNNASYFYFTLEIGFKTLTEQ